MKTLRVVMIEDDPDLSRGWREIFTLIGHEFKCFNSAKEILADEEAILNCDIVISDFYLPDVNGVELIKRIRHMRNDIPAILLTGSRDEVVVNAARSIDGCTILYKPVSIDDVEAKLNDMFET